jgi:hypothetical protein
MGGSAIDGIVELLENLPLARDDPRELGAKRIHGRIARGILAEQP